MSAGAVEGGGRPALRVVIAGGGTGGHVFPAIALAEGFLAANPDTRVLFAGTGNRLEAVAFGRTPFAYRAVSAGGLKGRSLLRRAGALGKVARGLWQSHRLLASFHPDLVIGVGGYVSGPMVLAAWLRRIPCALHEQNVIPGLANRMLVPLVQRVFTTFPDTRGRRLRQKMAMMGNPVRRELLAHAAGKTSGNGATGRFTVLVFGGSQGARRINRAVMDALPLLPLARMAFIHQTGAADLDLVRSAYAKCGAQSRVAAFFTDMGHQYLTADLVICRAGATTAAEVTALGKPAVFIPYPFAADDHQRLNAESLAAQGAAEMILEKELTGGLLAARIAHYERHPEALREMAARAATFGKPEAAERIVDGCYELLGEGVETI